MPETVPASALPSVSDPISETSKSLLRLVGERFPTAVAYVDSDERFRYRNRTHQDWFGRPGKLGLTVRELMGEALYKHFGSHMARALAGERLIFEFWVENDSGSSAFRATLIPDLADRRVRGCFILTEDLTEVNRVADALHHSQLELSLIMDSVPAMIWYKDGENRIVRCNRAAAESKGLRIEDIEGRPAAELFPPERAAEYYREDLEIMATGEPKRGIVEQVETPDGEKRWVETDKFPLRDESGGISGVVVFSVDATEREQAERYLQERKLAERLLHETEKAQKDFIDNVSHEFRTPLSAVLGAIETLRHGGFDDKRAANQFLVLMERHTSRLYGLVEQLLTLSGLESGRLVARPEALGLRACVEGAVAFFAVLMERKGVTFQLDIDDGMSVNADSELLGPLIRELLSNAVRFNRAGGGWVRVAAKARGQEALLTVSDGGLGIPEKDLPFVFDRFYRGSNTRKKSGHTGLGLYLAKKLADSLGGRLWAESEEGRGAAFHLTLPLGR
jgi:PAS domain S-box-containing protein